MRGVKMIEVKLGQKGEATWHYLYDESRYIAMVWGVAEVDACVGRPGFHVTIRDCGVIGGFFHCDEVEYKKEEKMEHTQCVK